MSSDNMQENFKKFYKPTLFVSIQIDDILVREIYAKDTNESEAFVLRNNEVWTTIELF